MYRTTPLAEALQYTAKGQSNIATEQEGKQEV